MKTFIISDTHESFENLTPEKDTELFIFTGDYGNSSKKTEKQFRKFIDYINQLKIKSIIIPGNHDTFILAQMAKAKNIIKYMSEDIYLLDNESIIINDKKFFGLSNQESRFKKRESDFLEKARKRYQKIEEDTEILLTHFPPYGILDLNNKNKNEGSIALLERIDNLENLKYHFFGHIHEGYGVRNINNKKFINVSQEGFYIDL